MIGVKMGTERRPVEGKYCRPAGDMDWFRNMQISTAIVILLPLSYLAGITSS